MESEVVREGLDYGMFERTRQAAQWFRDLDPKPRSVLVIGDDDPDGVTSAFVLAQALGREGFDVETRLSAVHSEPDVARAFMGSHDAAILADAGSALLPEIDALGKPILILDHHKVHDVAVRNVFEVNPRRGGGDKVEHVSASVVCQLFADALGPENAATAFAAAAGGVADRQHLGGIRGLMGHVFEEAVATRVVRRSEGITLPGRTLRAALSESIDPYFDGLSGDPDACDRFLKAQGLDSGADPGSLEPPVARALAEVLTQRLKVKHVVLDRLYPILGERAPLMHGSGVPTLFALTRILETLMAEDRHALALRVLSGRSKAAQTAERRVRHRVRRILDELGALRTEVDERGHLRAARTRDEMNTGTYAHILLTYVYGDDKPFLVYSATGKTAKFSGRGSPALWKAGVDLSIGMDRAAEAVGGHGGGHPGASGASVPIGRTPEFLAALDEELGRLRKAGRA